MIAAFAFVAAFALVLSLALIARPSEFDQAKPHEGASMREERAERYANIREIDARPDAVIVQFPPHDSAA